MNNTLDESRLHAGNETALLKMLDAAFNDKKLSQLVRDAWQAAGPDELYNTIGTMLGVVIAYQDEKCNAGLASMS